MHKSRLSKAQPRLGSLQLLMETKMDPENLGQLELLAGPGVQSLLRSRAATEASLDDPDPKLRWAAVILMTHHWGLTEEFLSKCEEMAFNDSDQQVRSGAISWLGALFNGTGNRRIGKLLASIVCNNSERYTTRVSAYRSLLRVNGASGETVFRESLVNLRIPEDINWELVESCQKTTEM